MGIVLGADLSLGAFYDVMWLIKERKEAMIYLIVYLALNSLFKLAKKKKKKWEIWENLKKSETNC